MDLLQTIPLKVLVADDDIINRLVLEGMLKDVGHDVILAENGQQAVDFYHEHQPDLILMDVMMPVMDGYEATNIIKQESETTGSFTPVIFLTAITDEEGLAQCINAGGDDFLNKPVSKIILLSKIKAMRRLSELYSTIHAHQKEMIEEQEAAKAVFNRLMALGSLDKPNLQYLNDAMSLFNGDLLIAADLPDGGMNILLGDATGHGLPAALGTMPVFDTFYDMCEKGIPSSEIVTILNEKLKQRLPIQYFICTVLIHLEPDMQQVNIWNCGLPEVIIYSQSQQQVIHRISATALPLGIRSGLDVTPVSLQLEPGDKIYAYSDGITEATNTEGQMFGKERLLACFDNKAADANIFADILATVDTFTSGLAQGDDLTMVEVTIS